MAQIICIRGRCGSGKDTVLKSLVERLPNVKVVHRTVTRPAKVEGEESVSVDEFERRLRTGSFIGVELYNGNWYGIDRSKVFEAFSNGNNVIVMGGNAGIGLQSEFPETIFIYLTAPIDQLQNRLLGRGESPEEVEKRLRYEEEYWEQPQSFDIVVENHDGKLESCLVELLAIIQQNTCHKHRTW